MRLLRLPLVAPIAIAVYSVLSLAADNPGLVGPRDMLIPLLVALLASALCLLALRLVRLDMVRACLIASVMLILLFGFSRVRLGLGLTVRNALLVEFSLLLALSIPIIRTRRDLSAATFWLNTMSVALLVFPVLSLTTHALLAPRDSVETAESDSGLVARMQQNRPETPPDIYYIILDGFGRSDVLHAEYGLDISPFEDYLTSRGFYVADASRANYLRTFMSIGSSLNMRQINHLADGSNTYDDVGAILKKRIARSTVTSVLSELGYSTVSFESGYSNTSGLAVDETLKAPWTFGEFENLLVRTTPLRHIILKACPAWDPYVPSHARRFRYIFDQIPMVAERHTGPVFVFAHILAPHPPFVFAADGTVNGGGGYIAEDGSAFGGDKQDYISGYRDQATYVMKRTQAMVDAILSNARPDPVIIIQGDHGPGSGLVWWDCEASDLRERSSIFNAYRIPAEYERSLYPDITPANSFRVVFDAVFDAGLPMVGDRTYFAVGRAPLELLDITNRLN